MIKMMDNTNLYFSEYPTFFQYLKFNTGKSGQNFKPLLKTGPKMHQF